ncbi:MAG: HAD-IA family hydrolase [Gluconacetobacter diazotrophicus]|nr:HAD-IA family hydrolase [Gluconacetobacter diazotrophicus]
MAQAHPRQTPAGGTAGRPVPAPHRAGEDLDLSRTLPGTTAVLRPPSLRLPGGNRIPGLPVQRRQPERRADAAQAAGGGLQQDGQPLDARSRGALRQPGAAAAGTGSAPASGGPRRIQADDRGGPGQQAAGPAVGGKGGGGLLGRRRGGGAQRHRRLERAGARRAAGDPCRRLGDPAQRRGVGDPEERADLRRLIQRIRRGRIDAPVRRGVRGGDVRVVAERRRRPGQADRARHPADAGRGAVHAARAGRPVRARRARGGAAGGAGRGNDRRGSLRNGGRVRGVRCSTRGESRLFPTFGLLFDLDGTMAHSDPAHLVAFQKLLAPYGRGMTEEEFFSEISGGANPIIMRKLFPDADEAEHVRLADLKEQLFRDNTPELDAVAGLHGLLERVAAGGGRVGVVTNAPRPNAEHMLRVLGLERLLDTIVLGLELPRSKPDPLPYLTGLERLGLPAAAVMGFEDSLTGVRSARGAGLFTVGMRTSLDDAALRGAGAHLTVADFDDPALDALLRKALAGEAWRPAEA